VSQSAVSFVLSGARGAERIPPETKRRIFAAARKLGYKRNLAGAALRRGYSDTMVVLAVSWDLAASQAPIAISISTTAWKKALHTDVQVVADDLEALSFLESVLSSDPFGLFLLWDTPKLPRSALLALKERGLPIVDLLPSTIDDIPSATADRRQGLRSVVEYLVGLGHREIGMVLDTRVRAKTNLQKLEGYKDGMVNAGIGFDEDLLEEMARPDFLSGQEGFRRLHQRRPGITAVTCTNDSSALGVIAGAHSMGLSVPRDISVVGHGNHEGGTYFSPTLTSLSVPSARIAEDAVAMMERMRTDEDCVPASIYEPEELVIRESTGPARVNPRSSRRS